jgi:hypothetical protein
METSKPKGEIIMDWYHMWIYTHLINTKWFLWTAVVFIFSLNILAPLLMWIITSSKLAKKKSGA